ncbi:hypothetical protein MIND_00782100 [Mycena indigotica]|uniref:HNH nuclease domain-containing protein n=1 Tax=Mycena indigotica TaxID=2126181 RepID=A0A8H6SNQ4_9AGAR|nr:uncharacterized protein MIND_00782100 [Mycena indigotica]KAF7302152.1 hypothetical protein MIND_00782100 [Mycena indigotica]
MPTTALSTASLSFREPVIGPSSKPIRIFHPAYDKPTEILHVATYPHPDDSDNDTHGLPLRIVLVFCFIIANNKKGLLREKDSGSDMGSGDVWLCYGDYTYDLAESETPYPICTTFSSWAIPVELPEGWGWSMMGSSSEPPPASNQSNLSTLVKALDKACLLTGKTFGLETCHLVPRSERKWWNYNTMNAKLGNIEGIDSPQNCISLRGDLNGSGMDAGHFIFAPYRGYGVCVCLTNECRDVARDLNLSPLRLSDRLKPHCFFARCAWGLFKSQEKNLEALQHAQKVPIPEELRNRSNMSQAGGARKKSAGAGDRAKEGGDRAERGQDQMQIDNLKFDLSARPTDEELDQDEEIERELQLQASTPNELAQELYPGFSNLNRLKVAYLPSLDQLSYFNTRIARVGDETLSVLHLDDGDQIDRNEAVSQWLDRGAFA